MISKVRGAGRSAATAEDLIIRPIDAADKPALVEGFNRLSADSRYRRFLSPHPRLTDQELRYFTEVDHHDHEALVAVDPRTGDGIGVARYVRSTKDPAEAEFAVAVIDDWQQRGVGTRLAEALADRAREEGVTRLTGLVLAGNQPMLNLAADLGDVEVLRREPETIELAVSLPERGLGGIAGVLRATAAGHFDALPLRLAHLRS